MITRASIQDVVLAEVAKSSPIYTDDLVQAIGLEKRQVVSGAAHVRRKGLIASNRANMRTPCRFEITNAGRIKMGIEPVEEIAEKQQEQVCEDEVMQPPENPLGFAYQIEAISARARWLAEQQAKAKENLQKAIEKRVQANIETREQLQAKNRSEVLQVVVAHAGWRTYEIAKAAGRERSTTRGILRELEKMGKVRDVGCEKVPRWVAA